MYEDEATTTQQIPHNTNSDNSKSVKRDYVKVKWLKKPEILKKDEILSRTAIEKQIGICTLCQCLPSSDCVQLPKCLCYFCRECFNTYLDKFSTPKPVLKESYLSFNPAHYRKGKKSFEEYVEKNSKVFGGVFDANTLSFEGDVLPKQPKPNIIKKVSDFEESGIRKTHLYKLIKVEVFNCPNCLTDYEDLNRTNLKRHRVVGDIIELMNKK